MRALPALLVLASVACGGKDDGPCQPGIIELTVEVIDVQEEPVLEAQVEIDQEPCAEVGGGVYTCEIATGGEHHLYVAKLPQFKPYARFLEFEEPGCSDVAETHQARLDGFIGGVR